jgi:large subunit ribosomal protein L10
MNREEKEQLIEELSQNISDNSSVILTDLTGINVKDITSLRRSLKENEATLRVVKNTFLIRAAAKSSMGELVESLEGPTALVLSDNPVNGVKVLTEFAKKRNRPKIKMAFIEGSIFEPEEVIRLATLPPKPVLISMVMAGMNSPLVQAVNLMRGVLVKFLLTLEAVKDVREKKD